MVWNGVYVCGWFEICKIKRWGTAKYIKNLGMPLRRNCQFRIWQSGEMLAPVGDCVEPGNFPVEVRLTSVGVSLLKACHTRNVHVRDGEKLAIFSIFNVCCIISPNHGVVRRYHNHFRSMANLRHDLRASGNAKSRFQIEDQRPSRR